MTRSSSSRPETAAEETACRRQALNALARREHSRLELERKLDARGYATQVIAATLDALESSGLIDVERFCDSFVRSRKSRGQGPARIERELTERGIDSAAATLALSQCEDWNALARNVRQRKFGERIPREYKERAKQMRFLQYRGFSHEQIRAALEPDPDSE
ncbi:MAG TPA: regulatory protein RecX [Gammaproteobacteria bacterium]|nr:regulatory protein RecX [Gammaproteobacteria bacterium]